VKKEIIISGGKLFLILAGVSALVFIPTSFLESQHTVCVFRNLTGFSCPGCGMTRAISSLFHGDYFGAFHYNRLVVLVFPLLAYLGIGAVLRELKRILALARPARKEVRHVL
jgi:hypothetical protein